MLVALPQRRACRFTPGTGRRPRPPSRLAPGVWSSGAWPLPIRETLAELRRQTIRPLLRTITLSAAVRHRSSRCSESSTVVSASSFSRRSSPISSSPATGSSCEVGSSSTRSEGRPASAAPSATRCSSPPDSSDGRSIQQVRDPERERRLLDRRGRPPWPARPGSRAETPAPPGPCPSRPASRDPGTAFPQRAPALPDRARACPFRRR